MGLWLLCHSCHILGGHSTLTVLMPVWWNNFLEQLIHWHCYYLNFVNFGNTSSYLFPVCCTVEASCWSYCASVALVVIIHVLPTAVLWNWGHIWCTAVSCSLVPVVVEVYIVSPMWLPCWPWATMLVNLSISAFCSLSNGTYNCGDVVVTWRVCCCGWGGCCGLWLWIATWDVSAQWPISETSICM